MSAENTQVETAAEKDRKISDGLHIANPAHESLIFYDRIIDFIVHYTGGETHYKYAGDNQNYSNDDMAEYQRILVVELGLEKYAIKETVIHEFLPEEFYKHSADEIASLKSNEKGEAKEEAEKSKKLIKYTYKDVRPEEKLKILEAQFHKITAELKPRTKKTEFTWGGWKATSSAKLANDLLEALTATYMNQKLIYTQLTNTTSEKINGNSSPKKIKKNIEKIVAPISSSESDELFGKTDENIRREKEIKLRENEAQDKKDAETAKRQYEEVIRQNEAARVGKVDELRVSYQDKKTQVTQNAQELTEISTKIKAFLDVDQEGFNKSPLQECLDSIKTTFQEVKKIANDSIKENEFDLDSDYNAVSSVSDSDVKAAEEKVREAEGFNENILGLIKSSSILLANEEEKLQEAKLLTLKTKHQNLHSSITSNVEKLNTLLKNIPEFVSTQLEGADGNILAELTDEVKNITDKLHAEDKRDLYAVVNESNVVNLEEIDVAISNLLTESDKFFNAKKIQLQKGAAAKLESLKEEYKTKFDLIGLDIQKLKDFSSSISGIIARLEKESSENNKDIIAKLKEEKVIMDENIVLYGGFLKPYAVEEFNKRLVKNKNPEEYKELSITFLDRLPLLDVLTDRKEHLKKVLDGAINDAIKNDSTKFGPEALAKKIASSLELTVLEEAKIENISAEFSKPITDDTSNAEIVLALKEKTVSEQLLIISSTKDLNQKIELFYASDKFIPDMTANGKNLNQVLFSAAQAELIKKDVSNGPVAQGVNCQKIIAYALHMNLGFFDAITQSGDYQKNKIAKDSLRSMPLHLVEKLIFGMSDEAEKKAILDIALDASPEQLATKNNNIKLSENFTKKLVEMHENQSVFDKLLEWIPGSSAYQRAKSIEPLQASIKKPKGYLGVVKATHGGEREQSPTVVTERLVEESNKRSKQATHMAEAFLSKPAPGSKPTLESDPSKGLDGQFQEIERAVSGDSKGIAYGAYDKVNSRNEIKSSF